MAGLAAAFGRGAMTNHWADIANATCVIAWGANPVENHPAAAAHINRARFPKQFYAGTARENKTGAYMITIDPRKTRTALQSDMYVRIRPGSDIAFENGLIRYIIEQMESSSSSVPAQTKTNFFAFLNQTSNGTFFTDGSATTASTSATPVPGNAKYTDARFLVQANGSDYVRDRVLAVDGTVTATGPDNTTISNFPQKAVSVTADPNTVYNRLKAHVAPYTTAVVADICGCTEAEIRAVADKIIEHSRCSSANPLVAEDPTASTYRATTLLYAMGITQHTCGAQNIKGFATLQTLMGNMGRAGGGINALRGIHNVQGSTDMGLLYGNIPAYSGNPTLQYPTDPNAFGKYMDGLWGTPLTGTGNKAQMNGSYDDAYNTAAMALQQRGFYNMTLKWFGDYAYVNGLTGTAKRDAVNLLYSVWPKGNGDNHITMFRKMIDGSVKAAVVWGQNPAVTEPNQSKVREGLKNLDLLVVTDMFETETAACDRKATGITYLIPAASHVEKAGSVTNSGRTLQWRYKAIDPQGNSKDDLELMLRFARALDDANAFAHISAVWASIPGHPAGDEYDQLFGTPYGWPRSAGAYSSVSGTADYATVGTSVSNPTTYAMTTVNGAEWIAELIYREMCTASAGGGTIWIYTAAYDPASIGTKTQLATNYTAWAVNNRAKSRDNQDPYGSLLFSKWGYSWLVNRRVLYNNTEVTGDQNDFFMGPDSCSRLFVSTNTAVLNYSRWYRTIHRLADKPDTCLVTTTAPHVLPGRFPAHVEPYESPRTDLITTWGQNTKGTAAADLVPADTARGTIATYPLVLTTIRCVEHFQGGPITRNNPYNVEAEPEPWVEINSVDARRYGIVDGDLVNVITARSNSTSDQQGRTAGAAGFAKGFRARVGAGLQSNQRTGPGVVAIPWHWGDRGLSTGSRANDLCIDAMDANTTIPEYKACLCRIVKL